MRQKQSKRRRTDAGEEEEKEASVGLRKRITPSMQRGSNAITQFVAVTGADESTAKYYLEANGYDLEVLQPPFSLLLPLLGLSSACSSPSTQSSHLTDLPNCLWCRKRQFCSSTRAECVIATSCIGLDELQLLYWGSTSAGVC